MSAAKDTSTSVRQPPAALPAVPVASAANNSLPQAAVRRVTRLVSQGACTSPTRCRALQGRSRRQTCGHHGVACEVLLVRSRRGEERSRRWAAGQGCTGRVKATPLRSIFWDPCYLVVGVLPRIHARRWPGGASRRSRVTQGRSAPSATITSTARMCAEGWR